MPAAAPRMYTPVASYARPPAEPDPYARTPAVPPVVGSSLGMARGAAPQPSFFANPPGNNLIGPGNR